jgi:hypothetical protein
MRCKFEKDYIYDDWMGFAGFYMGTFFAMIFFGFFGNSSGLFWRTIGLLLIGTIEARIITSTDANLGGITDISGMNGIASNPGLASLLYYMSFFLPHRANFQKIIVLRHCYVYFSIAISQLGPVISMLFSKQNLKPMHLKLQELDELIDMTSKGSLQAMMDVFEPFRDSSEANNDETVTDENLNEDGETRQTHASILLQRRMEKLAVEGHIAESDPFYAQQLSKLRSRSK